MTLSNLWTGVIGTVCSPSWFQLELWKHARALSWKWNSEHHPANSQRFFFLFHGSVLHSETVSLLVFLFFFSSPHFTMFEFTKFIYLWLHIYSFVFLFLYNAFFFLLLWFPFVSSLTCLWDFYGHVSVVVPKDVFFFFFFHERSDDKPVWPNTCEPVQSLHVDQPVSVLVSTLIFRIFKKVRVNTVSDN